MNAGSIHNPTAAGRVYRWLEAADGAWVSGMELTLAARVTAVSTRVSEVRFQINPDPESGRNMDSDEQIEHMRDGRGNYYRIVAVQNAGQMELAI